MYQIHSKNHKFAANVCDIVCENGCCANFLTPVIAAAI